MFKQNHRAQTPITTMSPLQSDAHTTKGHGFVDGSHDSQRQSASGPGCRLDVGYHLPACA